MSFGGPLDILILHFNTPSILLRALHCIRAAVAADREHRATGVWVLDNASEPRLRDEARAAVESLSSAFGQGVHWIESAENLGFARGMNQLWQRARPQGWVLFLNSDVEFDPSFLSELRRHLPVGPRKCYFSPVIEEDGKRYWGGRMQLWRGTARMTSIRRPARGFASGSALVVPADLLPRDGPWNEAFFFYGEDVELSARLERMGWQLRLLPIVVKHAGRSSLRRERAIELHYRGRSNVIRELPLTRLRRAAIRSVVYVELVVKTAWWMLSGQASIAKAAWRGWRPDHDRSSARGERHASRA